VHFTCAADHGQDLCKQRIIAAASGSGPQTSGLLTFPCVGVALVLHAGRHTRGLGVGLRCAVLLALSGECDPKQHEGYPGDDRERDSFVEHEDAEDYRDHWQQVGDCRGDSCAFTVMIW
jgi:hypothetical protein